MADHSRDAAVDIVSPKKIPGSPSLDEQFSGGRNPHSKSLSQIAAEHERQQRAAVFAIQPNKKVRVQTNG
jgi:hypothetical protein